MSPTISYFVFLLAYAVLLEAGGVIGWKKAGSRASLVAGLASGLLLTIAAVVGLKSPEVGASIALLVCILLLGRFLPAALRKQRLFPDWIVAGMAVVGIGLSGARLAGML